MEQKDSSGAAASANKASTDEKDKADNQDKEQGEDAEDKKPAAAAPGPAEGQQHDSPAAKSKSPKRRRKSEDSTKRSAATTASPAATTNDQMRFPERLMQLINDDTAPDHVGWIDSEEAISFKTEGFQEAVLNRFFQGLKHDSFIRKLNRWFVYSVV